MTQNIFSRLPADQFFSFHKGDVLFHEGEHCTKVGFLRRGTLRISSYDHHGNEILYNTIREGQVFGNNLIFSSEPLYRGDVIAMEDVEVYLIGYPQLLMLLE